MVDPLVPAQTRCQHLEYPQHPQHPRQVFSVIPDPACAPWDEPRSVSEFGWRLDSFSDRGLFGRLRRAPGARVKDAMTLEAWIAHWQMVRVDPSLDPWNGDACMER